MIKIPHFLPVIFSLILSSCTISVTVNLFNNTKNNLTVIFEEEEINIIAGQSESLSGSHGEFVISSEKGNFLYSIGYVHSSNISWEGWGPFSKRVFYAQLESDGKIWATNSEAKYPVIEFKNQPDGFPIEPKIEKIK